MLKMITDVEALKLYQKYFPYFVPNIFQQELIEACVTDMEVWDEVLRMWAGNDYRPQSIQKMIDCYDDKIKQQKPVSTVRNQPTQREAIEAELRALGQ